MVTFFVYKVVAPIKFDGNCSREFMVFMQPAGGWAVLYLAASATLFFFSPPRASQQTPSGACYQADSEFPCDDRA